MQYIHVLHNAVNTHSIMLGAQGSEVASDGLLWFV